MAMPVAKLSVKEYLTLDRAEEIPSEYHDGEMFPMVATTWQHGLLQANLCRRLSERLDNSACRVFGSVVRVRASLKQFIHPDIAIICGKPASTDEHQDSITNPKVIVEILSPSTENYEYGGKFILYRRLESFEEYLLVSQDRARVEVFRRAPDHRWILSTCEGLEAVVPVESLGISLPLAEVYAGLELPALDLAS